MLALWRIDKEYYDFQKETNGERYRVKGSSALIAPVNISSHGCEWAAENIAKLLSENGVEAKVIRRTDPCRLKIMIGFYQANNPQAEKAELLAAEKRIIWWVGTDILWMEKRANRKQLIDWINENVDENWGEWEHSVFRLRALGICNAKTVHMPTRHRYELMPLPQKFTVGCYCYNSRQAFYGHKIIMEAAKRSHDINWLIYPRYRHMVSGNIEEVPRVPADKMHELYARMSVHCRIVASDGMPQGPMEAAMCGRPVIYNFQQMKHMIWIKPVTVDGLIERVRTLREKQLQGKGFNIEGAEHWRKRNDPKKLVEEVRCWL